MKRENYRNKILKESVIPSLRDSIDYLNGNVVYNYPETNAKFPLVVCNIYDTPRIYDVSKNELITTIVINMDYFHNKMSDVLDLCFDVESVMIKLGYTRTAPSQPIKNANNNKWEITQQFRIQYNALIGHLERTIQ